jgi:CRISPR-associated protein Cas2
MYLVSYDISNTKLRNKIFKELKNYGLHVQFSVFECDLDKKRYREMFQKLLKLMENCDQGNIRIYSLCSSCQDNIEVIGIPDDQDNQARKDMIYV